MEQGIDHLVSLSPEKIPPHYAFPDLKHTLIPVEDFTGPTIAEIQKFIEITDTARRDGEVLRLPSHFTLLTLLCLAGCRSSLC